MALWLWKAEPRSCTALATEHDHLGSVNLPKSKESSGCRGAEEQLVHSHVSFLGADPADQLDCLLGREGVHCKFLRGDVVSEVGECFGVGQYNVL